MTEEELEKLYRRCYKNVLTKIAGKLENHIKDIVKDYPRIDRVTARAKSPERFLNKARKMQGDDKKYSEPLRQIQDQIGARIITFYMADIDPVSMIIKDYFAPIEERRIVPDSVSEFGYEGKHYVLFIPQEFITPAFAKENCPDFFELQIKTLFQHSWAEANHDLAYKPHSDLTPEERRKIAFTAAQAWGADQIFNELCEELTRNDETQR